MRYVAILGILIGPLALSCFFELIRMYPESYVEDEGPTPTAPAGLPVT